MDLDELRKALIKRRPALGANLKRNEPILKLALELRKMRVKAGLSQEVLSKLSGLSIDVVEELESPSGAIPTDAEVQQFKKACGDADAGQS